MIDMIQIAVSDVEPAPQGSKSYMGSGRLVESCKRVKPWRYAVEIEVRRQMRKQDYSMIRGACHVQLEFRFHRPKSHFTTNKQLAAAAPRHYTVKKNDIDKCCRSTLDALTDTVIADDSLVISMNAEKRYCTGEERAGALITIVPIT